MSAKQSGNHDQPPKGTVIVIGAGMAGKIAVCTISFDSSNSSILRTRLSRSTLHTWVQHASEYLSTASCTLYESVTVNAAHMQDCSVTLTSPATSSIALLHSTIARQQGLAVLFLRLSDLQDWQQLVSWMHLGTKSS